VALFRRQWRQPPRRQPFVYSTGVRFIAGTATIAFANTGVLVGAGALAGAADLVFDDGASILTGAGALAGTAALTFSNSGTLQGVSLIAGTAAVVFSDSGVLSGAGALLGTAALAFGDGDSVLTGAGAIQGQADLVFGDGASVLTGAGALAGSAALAFVNEGTLTGQAEGALAGTAAMAFLNSGTLTGEGALAGQIDLVLSATLQTPEAEAARQLGGGWKRPTKTPREIDEEIRKAVKRQRINLGILPQEVAVEARQDVQEAAQAVLEITGDRGDEASDADALERAAEAEERYIERMRAVYQNVMAGAMRELWRLEVQRRLAEEQFTLKRNRMAAALLLAAVS